MEDIFDSHAHYDDERFEEDMDEVLQYIQENGVTNVINVGCNIERSHECVALAKKYPFIYAAVGVHPHDAVEADPDYLDEIDAMLQAEKVVALGEIGLDYHYDFSPRDVQKRLFEEQLQLAIKRNVPVIIHSREAAKDTMDLLHRYQPKGVVHCFTGSVETAIECVKLGLYIGFTGVVTFPNARKTLDVIAATPINRILLETDCPYMAPVPFRGKRTTSDMIEKTAEVIANIKNVSTQEMIDIARENTKQLFLKTK